MKQFIITAVYNKEKAENANIKDAVIMQEKVINEWNLSMEAESSTTASAELQTIEVVRKVEKRNGNAIETIRKRTFVKETENEMRTSGRDPNNTQKMNEKCPIVIVGNGSIQNKRKPKIVRHIIEENIEQNGSKRGNAVQVYFDESNEEPIDLSSRNGQGQVLDKQSDEVISNRREHCAASSSSAERKRYQSELSKFNQKYGNRTFSTFTLAEQEELQKMASKIREGATFTSFDEFEKYFEAYKIAWNYPYRRASSEYLRDGEGHVIERYKYKYIVYHCAHYGLPRKRGGGKRPNQSYLPLGCEARFRLNSDTTNGCLRISSFHKQHKNHNNTEEDYLRVINKKRRTITGSPGPRITKEEPIEESEETMQRYKNNEERMLYVGEQTNAPEVARSKCTPVVSSPGNSIFQISSQQNSAFVPITHSAEMIKQGMNKISHQNISQTDSILKQIFETQLWNRLKRIEYLIMNVYIINCGRHLPQEVYLPFIHGIYGADYHLSEWSNIQLRDVTALLLQPPEILLQGLLPSDISINEVKKIRPPGIQRAITAIREEKLKRCNKILTPFIKRIFNSFSPTDFSVAVEEFRKLADDVTLIITDNITKP